MNLLVITQKLDLDSILGFTHLTIEYMAKRFKKVHVICLYKGRYDLPENVVVHSLGKENKQSKLGYIINFYKIYFSIYKDLDRIYVHMNQIYVYLLQFAFLLTGFKKIIFWKSHGNIAFKEKFTRHFVSAVATASDEFFDVKTKKKRPIGIGIDTNRFVPDTKKKRGKTLNLIFVGRISRIKHVDILIEAVSKLDKKINWKLDVYGPCSDKEYESLLKSLISKHKLQKKVKLHGLVSYDKIHKIYAKADIFLDSSQTGSRDKTAFEAMACGSVLISSNPPFKEVLGDYKLPLSIENTSESFAMAVEKIYSLPAKEYVKLTSHLRDLCVKDYSIDSYMKRLIKVIKHPDQEV